MTKKSTVFQTPTELPDFICPTADCKYRGWSIYFPKDRLERPHCDGCKALCIDRPLKKEAPQG